MLLAWQLARRFRSGNRQNAFISFVSASSITGIALGCLVLILLLSVMNGFERELKNQLLAVIPHGELYAVKTTGMTDWQGQLNAFASHPEILTAQAYTKVTGLLQKGKYMKAIEVTGLTAAGIEVDPMLNRLAKPLKHNLIADQSGILLGKGAMEYLKVEPGDRVQLLVPQLSTDLALKAPKSLWFTVLGSLDLGGELSNHIAVVQMETLSEALGVSTGAQGVRLYLDDPFAAQTLVRQFGYNIDQPLYISSWLRTHGHLYQDIQLVRTVVYLVLSLVIAVACFNIVSTLVMAVNEKTAEIAMLKTMGAKQGLIVSTFMFQGLINGMLGVVIGCALGSLLAIKISDIALWLEKKSGLEVLSGDIYFIDFLPSQLVWQEVVWTALIALGLSVLATLYPAKKAAQIAPAQGIKL